MVEWLIISNISATWTFNWTLFYKYKSKKTVKFENITANNESVLGFFVFVFKMQIRSNIQADLFTLLQLLIVTSNI